jgi:HD-GYP domain-containing protein (c-di-GMP phosphodiesterase class II)
MRHCAVKISIWELIMGISEATDLISPAVADHHLKVAIIANSLAHSLGWDQERLNRITVAAIMHDIGALSLQERLSIMRFETSDASLHAARGYIFLREFGPFNRIAEIVLHHHCHWEHGRCRGDDGSEIPLESHVIHLADRIAVLIDSTKEILGQTNSILEKIRSRSGDQFNPALVEAALSLGCRESFWLEAISSYKKNILKSRVSLGVLNQDGDRLLNLARLFARIIDFRSRFTSTHSSGVAAVAEQLAYYAQMSSGQANLMRIAGFLHDIGKLSVPAEILEKPGPLDENEINVMRKHTFYTYQILSTIKAFETIREWAALHHERLNGCGYPFHLSETEIPMGSRIMAIADTFTAICEDRPYRKGMPPDIAVKTLKNLVESQMLDANLINLAIDHYESLDKIRIDAQQSARKMYAEFDSIT